MRKFAWALGVLLTLAAPLPLAADGARIPAKPRAETQLALFQERSIFRSGLRNAHTIALTFDDGPNAHTSEVLDALKEMNVKATFFIVGNQARRHPDVLARIAREGHLLANHSGTHAYLGSRYDADPDRLLNQLHDVHEQIAPLMAKGDKFYFRAPYGAWRSAHADILNSDPELRRYVGPIYWDVGGYITMSRDGYVMSAADWQCWRKGWEARTCAKGYSREIRRADGGVVLMHCIHLRSADLVRQVVPALIEEGYRFVRLDQMPEYRQYETPGDRGVADARKAPQHFAALRPEDIK
ncbi:MAG: polysaccharide deacetylase family protein [Alphaproteobacteria bacterium]|nr:polysaccharide deacetylase family protein [Alphaproteobacteria bacterium]